MEELEISIKKAPEASKDKVCDVEITMATNGWTVQYRIKSYEGKKDCDHVEWTRKSFVFTNEQEDEAFEKFKALKKMEVNSWY